MDRVIHDEVVALIRMSANDLTLRVRSVGVVPFKGRGPGDKLTWKRLCAQRSMTYSCNGDNVVEMSAINNAGARTMMAATHSSGSSSEVSSFVYHQHHHHHHNNNNHHLFFLFCFSIITINSINLLEINIMMKCITIQW